MVQFHGGHTPSAVKTKEGRLFPSPPKGNLYIQSNQSAYFGIRTFSHQFVMAYVDTQKPG